MAKLGLVTVLFKSDDVLEDFFSSLFKQSYRDFHLYVIDNTPSEKTDFLLQNLLDKFPVPGYSHIKNYENVGVAKGNNQGIQLALQDGVDYILLLNNDIEFSDANIFSSLIDTSINEGYKLLAPKILFFGSDIIWMNGGGFDFMKGITKHYDEGKTDYVLSEDFKICDYVPTCFVLINAKIFEQVGFMDEQYFVYYDDTDFMFRCYSQGFKILVLQNFKIYHKVSFSSGGGNSLTSIYYNNRNRFYFIRKNFKSVRYIIAMTYSLFSRLLIFVLFKKDQKKVLIKALKEGLKMPIYR
jgi:hypothetical protein